VSRVGRLPVPIPSGVEITINGQLVSVKGPKGTLSIVSHAAMEVTQEDSSVIVKRPSDSRENRSLHGMTRALINNMVIGVTKGYERKLEIQGVGYTAKVKGKILVLKLGFTHDVAFHLPEGITVVTPKPTQVEVTGIDKALVGEVAAVIRGFKPPEPYKGKGIRYVGEYVERKAGKAGKTA
jgi:large subunit ribosomal protein L6